LRCTVANPTYVRIGVSGVLSVNQAEGRTVEAPASLSQIK